MNSRRPTQADVAKLARVSRGAVSRILNNQNGDIPISEKTRQRVLAAVDELGYVPNQAARDLRMQGTHRVCMAIPTLGEPFSDLVAADLQAVAVEHGYSVVIQIIPQHEGARGTLRQMLAGMADGLLLNVTHLSDELVEELEHITRMGIAVVVNSNFVSGVNFDIVRNGERRTSTEAVQYLIDQGHDRIALICHRERLLPRYESYTETLRVNDIPLREDYMVIGADNRLEATAATENLLRLPDPTTALFVGSDRAAVSAIWAAQRLGFRVPDDLAIIGVGNIPEGESTHPRLTTIGPRDRDFKPLAELLFSQLNGQPSRAGRVIEMPWQLIVRESA